MNLKIAQVVGLNTDQKAAQVISVGRDGESYFFAVLLLSCDDAFTRGRQALSELADFYFDAEAGSAGEKLTAAFAEARKKFEAQEFSLLLASVSGKILYLVSSGEVEVYLKRLEKLSPLLSVGAPSQLISGFLQEEDRLFLTTRSLVAFLGDDLTKSLQLPLETFEQELSDRVGLSDVEDQCLAALLVEVELPARVDEDNIANLQRAEPLPSPASDLEDSPKINPFLNIKKILAYALAVVWQQKKYFPGSNRGRLVIAALLVAAIILGAGFKVKAGKDARLQADFNLLFKEARDNFESSKGLSTLNPVEAKSKLDIAKDKVNKALSLKPKDNDAQNLSKQIEQDSSFILQQSTVSDFPLFLDMDLVKKNFRASQISLSNGKILLLDPTVKTLAAIDLAKKSNQILAGSEQLGDAAYASLNGAHSFVYSKDKGVLRIDITNQKTVAVAKKDDGWGDIVDIYGFAGNVYLLDPGRNMIWKYLPAKDGYSDKREYLSKAAPADLANALRMQIESSVYVLKKDGTMLRFTRGEKDNFSYEGLPSGVKEPKSFFVSSDTDNLYILDSGNSRILILTKTGSYKGQLGGDKFGSASDLAVDEKEKKIYLLEGSKIYSVDLK